MNAVTINFYRSNPDYSVDDSPIWCDIAKRYIPCSQNPQISYKGRIIFPAMPDSELFALFVVERKGKKFIIRENIGGPSELYDSQEFSGKNDIATRQFLRKIYKVKENPKQEENNAEQLVEYYATQEHRWDSTEGETEELADHLAQLFIKKENGFRMNLNEPKKLAE